MCAFVLCFIVAFLFFIPYLNLLLVTVNSLSLLLLPLLYSRYLCLCLSLSNCTCHSCRYCLHFVCGCDAILPYFINKGVVLVMIILIRSRSASCASFWCLNLNCVVDSKTLLSRFLASLLCCLLSFLCKIHFFSFLSILPASLYLITLLSNLACQLMALKERYAYIHTLYLYCYRRQ